MPLLSTPILVPGSAESDIDEQYNWTARRSYQCFFSPDTNESAARAGLGTGLTMYAVHPNDPSLVITNIHVKQDGTITSHPDTGEGCVVYNADITYSAWTPLLAAQTGNPVDAPPNYRWQCERGEIVAEKDKDGVPITNSVGDPYNPALMKNNTSRQFIVTMNMAEPNFFDMTFNWQDKVNSLQWGPFPPRSVLMSPINMPERSYSQVSRQLYYRMEFIFDIEPKLWDRVVANLGQRVPNIKGDSIGEDADGNPIYPLMNVLVEGNPATDPVLIGADNQPLEPPVTEDNIVYNTHKIYDEIDFNNFGLNDVFSSNNFPGGGGS